ncbi:MAG TPA: 3-oxoacyl-ACP reductase, partial [Massilibacterium sp.]|nr:3-oxoacyl-ACP reductase [Massilibacterium sp.]
MKLSEQVIVVTGGARGLGREITKAFANEGAKVVINYFKSEEEANKLVKEIGDKKAVAIQADVRDKKAVNKLFEKAKAYFNQPISTVVNNALINFKFDPMNQKNVENINYEQYLEQFEGSVKAALNTTQAAFPDMKEQQFGRIINIGTNLFQNPVVPYHEYTTGKAALLGFTRNMARDLGPYNITINMVSGGLLKRTDASKATTDEVFELIRQSTPMQQV